MGSHGILVYSVILRQNPSCSQGAGIEQVAGAHPLTGCVIVHNLPSLWASCDVIKVDSSHPSDKLYIDCSDKHKEELIRLTEMVLG